MFFCIAMSRGIPREEPYFSREESRLPRSFFRHPRGGEGLHAFI